MKKLDIRFAKEYDKNRIAEQTRVIARLEKVLPERIAERFKEVDVRIRVSSSAGFDVSGFRSSDEKEAFIAYLEELWQDSSLVEEY